MNSQNTQNKGDSNTGATTSLNPTLQFIAFIVLILAISIFASFLSEDTGKYWLFFGTLTIIGVSLKFSTKYFEAVEVINKLKKAILESQSPDQSKPTIITKPASKDFEEMYLWAKDNGIPSLADARKEWRKRYPERYETLSDPVKSFREGMKTQEKRHGKIFD